MDFRIEDNQSFRVLAMTRVFDEKTSAMEIPKFWSEFMDKGLQVHVCGVFGICHSYQVGHFSYSIADPYVEGRPVPDGFEVFEIPAYTWAKFSCVGPMPKAIQETWKSVYEEWVPTSNYSVIPGYDIEMYMPGDVNSPEYKSEIWIPVKANNL